MTGDGHTLTSVGVRAGGFLNSLGIKRNTMNDENGPVMPVLRSYLASDPASVPARIVNNINEIVTSKVTPPANLGGGNQPTTGTNEGDNSMGIGTILLIIAGGVIGIALIVRLMFPPRRPTSTYTPPTRQTPRPTLRKSASGFEGRLSDSRRNRAGGTAAGADGPDSDDDTRRRNDNDGINTAAAAGAGVVAGVLLSEAARRNNDEPRRDSGSSDGGYVPPVVSTPSCSAPSTPSCSSGSSCSSGGGSCGGGGGGGGCGGGGSSCGGGGSD